MKKTKLRKWLIGSSYLLIVASILITSLIWYFINSVSARHYAEQKNQELINQVEQSVSLRLDNVEILLRNISYDIRIQDLLHDTTEDNQSGSKQIQINNIISNVTSSTDIFDNVVMFSARGKKIGSMLEYQEIQRISEASWFSDVEASTGETKWLIEEKIVSYDIFGSHLTLPAMKKIRSIQREDSSNVGDTLGYLMVFINIDRLVNISIEDPSLLDRHLLVVDETNQIIGGNRLADYGKTFVVQELDSRQGYTIYDNTSYLLGYQHVSPADLDLLIVSLTPRAAIMQQSNLPVMYILLISMGLLLAFLFMSFKSSNLLNKPIIVLQDSLRKIEKGDFDTRITEESHILELDDLMNRFNVMANQLDTLIFEVYESRLKEHRLQAEARQAELDTLQMQINPHFLYNTLDSINWKALMCGNEEISKMTIALGSLFRSNMNTEGMFTSVGQDVENLKLFIYIEQVRFGDKLSFDVIVSDGARRATILKHLLQPLLENAIKHGFEPGRGAGQNRIEINIYEEEADLLISVADSGRGMSPEKQAELMTAWINIRRDLDLTTEQSHGGIGLRNIMRRLYLCYDQKASFKIESDPARGTEIRIKCPAQLFEP